jgi:hypothetical protein
VAATIPSKPAFFGAVLAASLLASVLCSIIMVLLCFVREEPSQNFLSLPQVLP